MARQEPGNITIFCLTGVKKNDTETMSQKRVHFMEKESQFSTEEEPVMEYASPSTLLDCSKDKNRVISNLKKIRNVWKSWSCKTKSASHIREADKDGVEQHCNLHESTRCQNEYLKQDQSQVSVRNCGNCTVTRKINHKEKTVQEKATLIPDIGNLRDGIMKENISVSLKTAYGSSHPAKLNPENSYEPGSSLGRKNFDLPRKGEVSNIKYERKLTEVKKLSPKAIMLRGILNRIRTAGTENKIETTSAELQRHNGGANIEKLEQEPKTQNELARFLSGVDEHGLEQFFSFCDKILLSESRRYSCMTASEFASKRKKNIDIRHKERIGTAQGLTVVNLNSKLSPNSKRDFMIKNSKQNLSSSTLSTDESSLEFEAPVSSTPVIAGSFRERLYVSSLDFDAPVSSTPVIADSSRERLYDPHISSICIDHNTIYTEQNDESSKIHDKTNACIDMSSSQFWRSDYALPPNILIKDYIPTTSKWDTNSVNDTGEIDIAWSKSSQTRRQTKDFVKFSTGIHRSNDASRNSYNSSRTTCDKSQCFMEERESQPVGGLISVLNPAENSVERNTHWDCPRNLTYDYDSGCGYSMNSGSEFLGNI